MHLPDGRLSKILQPPLRSPRENARYRLQVWTPRLQRPLEPALRRGLNVAFWCTLTTPDNVRRYPRFSAPKGTILAWQTASHKEVSQVSSVGLGGMYIRTPQPPPHGALIQLLLDGPTGEVRARATVQHSETNEGMGVKFVSMQPEDRARFARWLDHLSV